jgi:peptidoglycan/LPS O-acetylase OafA/YrhL
MCLTGPALLSKSDVLTAAFLLAVAASSILIREHRAVFLYLPCFALGFIAFLYYERRLSVGMLLALLAVFAGLTAQRTGPATGFVGLISPLLILAPLRRPVPVLSYLGTISYSLYLLHGPIGSRAINLVTRLPDTM